MNVFRFFASFLYLIYFLMTTHIRKLKSNTRKYHHVFSKHNFKISYVKQNMQY